MFVFFFFFQCERGIMPMKRAIEEFMVNTADRREKVKMRDELLKIKRVLHSIKVSYDYKNK
jgi:hypothetical protein